MKLVRLYESETPYDDVPDENEWHALSPFDETACGLAWEYGSTDREREEKTGTVKDVTCQTCIKVINHYKRMR